MGRSIGSGWSVWSKGWRLPGAACYICQMNRVNCYYENTLNIVVAIAIAISTTTAPPQPPTMVHQYFQFLFKRPFLLKLLEAIKNAPTDNFWKLAASTDINFWPTSHRIFRDGTPTETSHKCLQRLTPFVTEYYVLRILHYHIPLDSLGTTG